MSLTLFTDVCLHLLALFTPVRTVHSPASGKRSQVTRVKGRIPN